MMYDRLRYLIMMTNKEPIGYEEGGFFQCLDCASELKKEDPEFSFENCREIFPSSPSEPEYSITCENCGRFLNNWAKR